MGGELSKAAVPELVICPFLRQALGELVLLLCFEVVDK